jgi:phytoene desaturase
MKNVAIVGAGVGGLAAAARLAHQGFEVEVYEQGPQAGGRAGQLKVDGFTFDTGPTLLLMPEVLEETFASVGRRLSDYLTLKRCDPNYKIHFRDGSDLTFTSDLVRMGQELERFEKGACARYLDLMAQGRRQYTTSLERFVGRNFDHLWELFTPKNLASVLEVKAHKNMYSEVARHFSDYRLRAAFTFQTMYLGISPFESPAVYGLLPYTELANGIWFPMGGLYELPRALERLCRELGVRFHYRTPVQQIQIEKGRATGLLLGGGVTTQADAVLCNADLPWAYKNLIDPAHSTLPRAEKLKYTSSAYMMYLGTRKQFPQLGHHTVVLGGFFEGAFEDIFEELRVPEDPSFYVNAPARTDPSLAPEGKDALYVLVPVPHRTPNIDWKKEGPRVRAQVFARLAELGVTDLESSIEVERVWTPDDYATVLNLERGSAFGLSHNFTQIGPFRPRNQDPNVQNLFFVGASTQPGTGVPMVMLSARLAVERMVGARASEAPRLAPQAVPA